MSLTHCERTLSQSHPTYLSQLRTEARRTKSGSDRSIVLLSTVSVGVLCVQVVTATFSTNVQMPRSETVYTVFGLIVALAVLELCVYCMVVRLWWVKARRRTGKRRAKM